MFCFVFTNYLLLSEFEPYSYEKESDWINSSLYPKAPLGDWPDCGLDVIRAEPTLGTHLVRSAALHQVCELAGPEMGLPSTTSVRGQEH